MIKKPAPRSKRIRGSFTASYTTVSSKKTSVIFGKKKAVISRIRKAKPLAGEDKDSRALALVCADLIEEKRGADVVILNVAKFIQIADYFIICTGKNKKQNQAIADNIFNNSKLYKVGYNASFTSIQGYEEGLWVLVDLGRVVVHIFIEQLRKHYDLEFLWAAAPKIKR